MPGSYENIVSLDVEQPIWDRFFTVAPLVLIGSKDENGTPNLAPKHLVTPMSWQNHFGFVCTPRHRTYQNIQHTGAFTVSYPRPTQVVITSLSAEPRDDVDEKPTAHALPTFPARQVDAPFIKDSYLYLECNEARIIDGYDVNSLITGTIVAAYVDEDALRVSDQEDDEVIHRAPLLAYIYPGRFASISETQTFPFPAGYKR